MPGETLKEFLVAVGFNVDENSYSKFNTKVGAATAGVMELGAETVATAVAIETAVARMARQFEDLFYVSQRTKSAVVALQSFEYGARTIGVSADQARGAVEGLSRAMRTNPGVGALLNQLGVKTGGRGSVEILGDLVGQLKKLPFYLASQYAGMVGIDSDTLLMLEERYDELKKAQEDYAKRQKEAGVDSQSLAEGSRTFGNALRSLEATLGLIGDRILQDFLGPMTKGIDLLDEGARKFIEIDKATNGWATTLGTLATGALSVWIGKLLLAKLLFRSAAAGLTEAEAAAAPLQTAGAATAGGAAGGAGSSVLAWLGPLGAAIGATYAGYKTAKAFEPYGGLWENAYGAKSKNNDGKRDEAVKFFMDQGWTREQALGLAANAHRESNFNEKAVGDHGAAYGIGQWHKDRQENFRAQFGKDIHDSTFEEQLKFMQYELTQGAEKMAGAMIRRAGSPEEAGAAVSKFYERPGDVQGEATSRGGLARAWYDKSVGAGNGGGDKSVVVNAKTDVHVRSTDPKQAAREVAATQDDTNANLARYAGATQR